MEANKGKEKWTTFHTEAAHRLFADDMEKIRKFTANEFVQAMRQKR